MASILEMMGHIDQQGEQGKQAGLSRLIGKAYNDPSQRQAALGRVAQFDGPAAFNAQAMFEKMDDRGRQRLGQRMAVFSALPDDIKAQAYPDIAREAQALGIPAPGEWNPEFAPHMQKIAQALTTGMQEMPTGFRQFQMTAEAAGLQPGTPEYQQAANIALGREGRASSAGFGFELTEGMDGRKRLQRRNPRTGAVEVYDESTGDFVPVGGMGGTPAQGGAPGQIMGDAMAGGMDPQAIQNEFKTLAPQFGAQISSLTRTPERNAAVGGVANSQHMRGTAGDFVVPEPQKAAFRQTMQQRGFEVIDEGDHMHVELPPRGQMAQARANPNLVVGRRPEDEALATETAKQSVQTRFLPQQEAIKTQAAIQQAGGVEQIKANIGAQADVASKNRDRTRDADAALDLLDEAEALVKKSTGSTGGALLDQAAGFFGQSTDGAEAIAALQTIAGQLTSRMPRMQGPQSDRDVELYKQMAGDLANPTIPRERRLAALAQIRRLNRKYASGQNAAQSVGGWGIRLKGSN